MNKIIKKNEDEFIDAINRQVNKPSIFKGIKLEVNEKEKKKEFKRIDAEIKNHKDFMNKYCSPESVNKLKSKKEENAEKAIDAIKKYIKKFLRISLSFNTSGSKKLLTLVTVAQAIKTKKNGSI